MVENHDPDQEAEKGQAQILIECDDDDDDENEIGYDSNGPNSLQLHPSLCTDSNLCLWIHFQHFRNEIARVVVSLLMLLLWWWW